MEATLAAGGTWRWGGAKVEWTFELGDGWDLEGVSGVFLVPFIHDDVLVLRQPWGHSAVGGTIQPAEHWSLAGARKLAEAGARLLPSTVDAADRPILHPFGLFRCYSQAARPPHPALPHPRHVRVAAWCEVELTAPPTGPFHGEGGRVVQLRGVEWARPLLHPEIAALYRLAADLRRRGVNDATWTRDGARLREEQYLRTGLPAGQPDRLGSGGDRDIARRLVMRPIVRDGTFLDLGCADGLLMESAYRWAAEVGRRIEPYGLDRSERLIALARARLPSWRDRFFVGDALIWVPPRPFDFVHTMVNLVPGSRRPEWLTRVLRDMVAPGGRLIVRDYAGIGERLRRWGLTVGGVIVQDRGARPGQEAAWIDAPT